MATSSAGIDSRKTMGDGAVSEGNCITTEAKEPSLEEKQQNESTSALETAGNQFNFSELSSLLNDPSIQNLANQIVDDPAFRNMVEELQCGIQPGGQQGLPQVNTEEYFNTMQQLMDNPQFKNMAERLSSVLMQDPASASILQNLRTFSQNEEVESSCAKAQSSPSLRPIVNEIEREGPATVLKYMDDPEVLGMLGNAIGFSFQRELTSENEVNGPFKSEVFSGKHTGEEKAVELPLHYAVSTGDTKVLLDLLEKGADMTERDGEGRVALHLACGYGELECAEALLEAGLPVDFPDRSNNTSLHYASGYGKQDCVELLLKYGAAVTLQNLDGKTPWDLAKLNDQTEVLKLLEKYAFL